MASVCRFEELEKEKRAAVKSIDEEAARKKKEAEDGKEILVPDSAAERKREPFGFVCLESEFVQRRVHCLCLLSRTGRDWRYLWWRGACSGNVVLEVFREPGPSKPSPHIPRRAERSSSEAVLGTSSVLEMKFLRCRYVIPRQIQAYSKPCIPVHCVETQC